MYIKIQARYGGTLIFNSVLIFSRDEEFGVYLQGIGSFENLSSIVLQPWTLVSYYMWCYMQVDAALYCAFHMKTD